MTLNSGARASVMKGSVNSDRPVICLIGRSSNPLDDPSSRRMGTRTQEMPLRLGASGSVRQRQNIMTAAWAAEVHTLWPVMTTSSPSMTPRVLRLARSEPASGSEKPWQ
jgi:hypothetical protein